MARRKNSAVPVEKRSTTSGSGTRPTQLLAGKGKSNKQASSGGSMEPAKRRPEPGTWSCLWATNSIVTGEHTAYASRTIGGTGRKSSYIDQARRPL